MVSPPRSVALALSLAVPWWLVCCSADGNTPGAPDALGPQDGSDAQQVADGAGPECSTDPQCELPAGLDPACAQAACLRAACEIVALPDQSPCSDGDPCTDASHCVAGACLGVAATSCDDGNPCTLDTCAPEFGCAHDPALAGQPCDDGDPCTGGDACVEGACVGAELGCACTIDADCAAFDDQDRCNGVLTCVTDHCRLEPGSAVACPDPGVCRVAACDAATGECATSLAPNGTACDDGNPCTVGDTCTAGQCAGRAGACLCVSDEQCKAFQRDDYDLCQGPLACIGGVCAADLRQAVRCPGPAPDADPCITTTCDPGTGLCASIGQANGTSCPPGDPCSPAAKCVSGRCVAGEASCDDGDPCTEDRCIPELGCEHTWTSGPCDDGDPCTAGAHCEEGACGGALPLVCDDLNPCTADLCSAEAGGCTAVPHVDGAACQGGDPCLVGGSCVDGVCVGQQPRVCDSAGPCATSACVSGEGCVTKAATDGTPCDTQLACNQPGTCQQGACVALPMSCSDGNPCTLDACDEALGECVHSGVPDGGVCDPPGPCLIAGACQAGACVGGEPVTCSSGPCEVQACDPEAGGCVVVAHAPPGTPCGAGPCLVAGACDGGVCKGVSPEPCDDGDDCTVDWCDPSDGSCHGASLTCTQPADACLQATCGAGGCTEEPAPECESGSVAWATSLPCEAAAQWQLAEGGGEGFAIATAAPAWDVDCALIGAIEAGDETDEIHATSPPFLLPDGPIAVVLTFVERLAGDAVRSVSLVDDSGAVVASLDLASPDDLDVWQAAPPVAWELADASADYRLRFTMAGATAAATWHVDKIVVVADAAP